MKTTTTLYDFFAMVIPGFLWLLLISFWCKWDFTFAGYGVDGIIGGTLLFIVSYTIGLLYHKVIECLTPFLRNNKCCIKKAWEEFGADYKKNAKTPPKKTTKGNLQEYYTAYYALMKEGMLNSIPVLEAQVAFLRNMAPIILVYMITTCCYSCSFVCINPCCLAIILLMLLVGVVIALPSIQNKIYYLVWEGYEYLYQGQGSDTATTSPQMNNE